MNRRNFIRVGLIYVPTFFACHGGIARLGNLDSEVGDWIKRTKDNGGGYTSTAVIANDKCIKLIKAAGIRSKILRLNLFCGDRNGSLAPLIDDAGASTDNAFINSSFSETTGWVMNNANEYISTGLNPSVSLSVNDAHLAIWMGGTAGAHTWIPTGVTGFGGNDFYMTTSYTGFGILPNVWTGTGRPIVADTDGTGYYHVSRTSGSADGVKVYKNGALVGTSTSVGGSPPDTTASAIGVVIMNCNNGGVALGGAPNTKAGHAYHIGKGFTETEVAVMYGILQRTETILGR